MASPINSDMKLNFSRKNDWLIVFRIYRMLHAEGGNGWNPDQVERMRAKNWEKHHEATAPKKMNQNLLLSFESKSATIARWPCLVCLSSSQQINRINKYFNAQFYILNESSEWNIYLVHHFSDRASCIGSQCPTLSLSSLSHSLYYSINIQFCL